MNRKIYLLLTLSIVLMLIFINCGGAEEVIEKEDTKQKENTDNNDVDLNDGPVFSYDVSTKYISNGAVKREVTKLAGSKISNPILVGTDENKNLIIYSSSQKKFVKFPPDMSLGVAIIKNYDGVISANINGKTLAILQSSGSGYSVEFFNNNGDSTADKNFTIGNIKEILSNEGINIGSKYDFLPKRIFVKDDGNVVISVVETSSDKSHTSKNIPTFITFNGKNVDKVIRVTPPMFTGYGQDYWKKTKIDYFRMDTAIYKNKAYILWGSGYSVTSSLGYTLQEISLKNEKSSYATRMMEKKDDKNNQRIESLPDKGNYASRGIWIDKGNIYLRLEAEGTDIIDVYSNMKYEKKYVLKDIKEMGKTTLDGAKNMVVMDNKVYWASDKSIKLIDLE